MSITVTFCLRSLGIPVFVHPKIHIAKRQNMYEYFSWKHKLPYLNDIPLRVLL